MNNKDKNIYKDGTEDGPWELYHENGQIFMKGTYVDGEQEGLWESFHTDGSLRGKGLYMNNKRDGIWEYYFPSGGLSEKSNNKNGITIDFEEKYYESGILSSKRNYQNGSWEEKQYHENGKLSAEGNIDYGSTKKGIWEYYDASGQLILKQAENYTLNKGHIVIEDDVHAILDLKKTGEIECWAIPDYDLVAWNKEESCVFGLLKKTGETYKLSFAVENHGEHELELSKVLKVCKKHFDDMLD